MAVIASADFGPDDDTLQRAQRGDDDAFAEIIEEHQAVVFSIAWHFFGDRDLAEEVAQDVFLRLYRKLQSVNSPSHLLFWLRQVTTRRCIDVLRRTGPRPVRLDGLDIPVDPAVSDPFTLRRLRRLVAALPDMQRMILTLRYQEDLGPAEIGQIVGMPPNTVKSCLHRAIVALRRDLGGDS